MSSRSAIKHRSPASRKDPAATPVAGVRRAVPVDTAANHDAPAAKFSILGDPLWGMAIASGILFAVLAALIAFG